MKFQTQNVDGNIGNTPYTLRKFGCKIACYSSILEVDIHQIANHTEYFDKDGLLIDDQKVCDDFGGEWNSNRGDIGLRPTVVETRFDGSLHFVVWDGNRFWDSLSINGTPLRDYQIISFRNVKKKGDKPMSWYSIKGAVFHDDVYVGDPAGVPWSEISKLNPEGYQIIDDDELRALQNKPPVEVIVEKPVPDATVVTALNKCNIDFKDYKKTHPDIQPSPPDSDKPSEPIESSSPSLWEVIKKWWTKIW